MDGTIANRPAGRRDDKGRRRVEKDPEDHRSRTAGIQRMESFVRGRHRR
jgi:hypothetical protein